MSAPDAPERPALEQRFSALYKVRTTIHDEGLVLQIDRRFRTSVATVGFDRLVLEPSGATGLRTQRLAWAAAVFGLAVACAALPPPFPWAAPGVLALAVLIVLHTVISPRRVTMLLDREGALHPAFLRDGADEPAVAEFLERLRRAALASRCTADSGPEEEAERPALADALDALDEMRGEGLLTEEELERFRELAARR